MNFIDNIASVFGYSKKISGIQTMIFTGNKKTPGFKIDLTSFYGLKDAYEKCSPISTIIGKLAMAMSNGKWWIVDENDPKMFISLQANIRRRYGHRVWISMLGDSYATPS